MPVMGLFRVPAHLTGPTGRSETVEVLVDTGATFLVVPRALAERLELRPTRTCPIQTAGGRKEAWPLAEVRLRLDESLLLAADPVARRLVPVEGFVGTNPRQASRAAALVG